MNSPSVSRTQFAYRGVAVDTFRQHRRCSANVLCVLVVMSLMTLPESRLGAQPTAVTDTNESTTESPKPSAEHRVAWLTSLEDAKRRARVRRVPVLVVAQADWCHYCRQLEEEIDDAAVQEELERWLPVQVDVDRQPRVAEQLAIGPIPALRILTPDGRIIASKQGFLPAKDLVAWLASQHESAALTFGADLRQSGPPNVVAVVRIVREFNRRDATLREAAVTRLLPHPAEAAPYVVARFTGGTLSEKLAALELLSHWNAPVEGIDPWIPNTMTADRVDAVNKWLATQKFGAGDDAAALTPKQVVEAQRLIRMMSTADPTAAASMREQLARMGSAVLPFLLQALADAPNDEVRARLTAARYRLAASNEIVLKHPALLEQLAAVDFDQRVRAADELAALATVRDEHLLLALFSDPTPLIREIGLQALQRLGGQKANSVLVKLLDDPDANVRAAVLKQIAEKPTPALVPRIAEYAAGEPDADLVVHAVRFLREVKETQAVDALIPLLQHASWRVRAEAADGIIGLLKKGELKKQIDQKQLRESFVALLQDEDSFVVSRAIQGLGYVVSSDTVEPIVQVADRHPELTAEVVRVLVKNFGAALARPHLQEYVKHKLPSVRAAAIAGLVQLVKGQALDEIKAGLQDEDRTVRIAVADAVYTQLVSDMQLKLKVAQNSKNVRSSIFSSGIGNLVPSYQSEPSIGGSVFGGTQPDENSQSNDDEQAAENPADLATEIQFAKVRQDRSLSQWYYDLQPFLQSLLNANDIEERTTAARPLAVLGNAEAFAVLRQGAATPLVYSSIAEVLPVLPWKERVQLFHDLLSAARSAEQIAGIAIALTQYYHPDAVDELWSLLASDRADADLINQMYDPFHAAYYAQSRYDYGEVSAERKQRANVDLAKYATTGEGWQRPAALALQAHFDREVAATLASQIYADDSTPDDFRPDALRVQLRYTQSSSAKQLALEAIESEQDVIQRIGVAYLALGSTGIPSLEGGVHLPEAAASEFHMGFSQQPRLIVPVAPEGLTAEQLQPFANSDDPAVAAQAAYLLILLNDRSKLASLIEYWRNHRDNEAYRKAAFRAIARANDAAYVADLNLMYSDILNGTYYPDSNIKEFYWTIRIMTVPQALALRKRIRDKHGAEVLR